MEEELGQLFDALAKEEVLEGEIGYQKAIDFAMQKVKLPNGFSREDLIDVLENLEKPEQFSKDQFIPFAQNIVTQLKTEIAPDPETPDPEDEEVLRLSPQFIAERLSDLQPVEEGSLSFAFTSFSVAEADIVDISALSTFQALFYISLKTNSISNLSPLNGLPKLKELYLQENKVVNFDGISLPSLEILDLSQNKFCSLGEFNTPKLKKLNLSQNAIKYISQTAFSQLSNLEELDLSQNKLKNFKFGTFAYLSNLKVLKLDQNAITEIPIIVFAGMDKLENLSFGENAIEKFPGMEDLPALKVLDMHQTAIQNLEDLHVLANLKNMNTIIFDGTPVTSVENFKSDVILMMPWLEKIDEEPISFADRQEALNLEKERKEAEEQARREKEEAEKEAAAAASAAENESTEKDATTTEETQDGTTTETQETTENETGTYDETGTYESTN
ncbi:regulation of response to stimulus [Trichomonas vaginalis G3]|nr:uncharacterized protein TVAGG3_0349430 [Trichomonas vaginalis G3]KAI5531175.1 regulation of response to stimulus [Trichomonas vaginalis G3]